MSVKKNLLLIMCSLILCGTVYSDSEPLPVYVPPEEPSPALYDEDDKQPEFVPWGIVSITVAAGGVTMTGFGIHMILENIDSGFESPDLQSGIMLTAGGGLVTAAASIFLEIILSE